VLPTTGKRSRSDTKADEILAKAEMDAKAKTAGTVASKWLELSTPETQDVSQPVEHFPPSLPPAKRVKTLAEPESPTRSVNKAFMTRKSVAKDGVAILAAVSKQKGGTVKPVAQEIEQARKEADFQEAVKELKKINTEMKSHLLKSPAWSGVESTIREADKRNAHTVTFVSNVAGAQKTSTPGNYSSVAFSEKAKEVTVSPASNQGVVSAGFKLTASVGLSRSTGAPDLSRAQQPSDTNGLENQIGATRQVAGIPPNGGKDTKPRPTTSRLSNTRSTAAPRTSTPQHSGSQDAVGVSNNTQILLLTCPVIRWKW
jgi:hypothetical protein